MDRYQVVSLSALRRCDPSIDPATVLVAVERTRMDGGLIEYRLIRHGEALNAPNVEAWHAHVDLASAADKQLKELWVSGNGFRISAAEQSA